MNRITLRVLLLLTAAACGDAASVSDAAPIDGALLPDAALSDAAPPDAWTPTPEDPAALRIASWNLEDFPKNGATLETVAALIEEHQLDLVGVQEITEPEPFEGLAALLPDHEMFVSFDPWGYTRVGFLYRTSLIEVGEVERIFTSERDAFPRDPLVAEIRVKGDAGETRFDFTLAVVHLKAQIDDESRLRRVAAVELLDGWVRERMLADPDVIIIGDFNDELTDPPEWNVFGPFLGDPETYRFLTLEAEERGAHSYIPFRAMIDHILVTTDVLSEYGRGVTEVLPLDRDMASYQTVVSDHLPVVASFELPPM